MAEVDENRAGTFGVTHGRPAHLMDAVHLSAEAWSKIAPKSIKNCFVKANIGVVYRANTSADGDASLELASVANFVRGFDISAFNTLDSCSSQLGNEHADSIVDTEIFEL